jgi:hypothetical protein
MRIILIGILVWIPRSPKPRVTYRDIYYIHVSAKTREDTLTVFK